MEPWQMEQRGTAGGRAQGWRYATEAAALVLFLKPCVHFKDTVAR